MTTEKNCGSCAHYQGYQPPFLDRGECSAPVPLCVDSKESSDVYFFWTGCPCHVEKEVK